LNVPGHLLAVDERHDDACPDVIPYEGRTGFVSAASAMVDKETLPAHFVRAERAVMLMAGATPSEQQLSGEGVS